MAFEIIRIMLQMDKLLAENQGGYFHDLSPEKLNAYVDLQKEKSKKMEEIKAYMQADSDI